LVEPGVTPVVGGSPLTDLTDCVLVGTGELFLTGSSAGGSGIYRLAQGQLTPVAVQGAAIPPLSDGTGKGLLFAGRFQLLPESARGELLFRAAVQTPGQALTRRASFALRQGRLETRVIESVGV